MLTFGSIVANMDFSALTWDLVVAQIALIALVIGVAILLKLVFERSQIRYPMNDGNSDTNSRVRHES